MVSSSVPLCSSTSDWPFYPILTRFHIGDSTSVSRYFSTFSWWFNWCKKERYYTTKRIPQLNTNTRQSELLRCCQKARRSSIQRDTDFLFPWLNDTPTNNRRVFGNTVESSYRRVCQICRMKGSHDRQREGGWSKKELLYAGVKMYSGHIHPQIFSHRSADPILSMPRIVSVSKSFHAGLSNVSCQPFQLSHLDMLLARKVQTVGYRNSAWY
jgi:hypothetical protein